MTDCGGLLVFEELLTAVHLHFNTVLLNLLMQFASQLCCHHIPAASQTNSKKPSSFNHFNCHEILVCINHFWIFTIRHRPLQLLSKMCRAASCKVFFCFSFSDDPHGILSGTKSSSQVRRDVYFIKMFALKAAFVVFVKAAEEKNRICRKVKLCQETLRQVLKLFNEEKQKY